MNLSSAILAILPPFFAIVVERVNPINAAYINPKVKADLERFENYDNHKALLCVSQRMVAGAVEVAGLAPTFVAVLSSGLGVLYEYPNMWLVIGYVLLLTLLVLLVMNFLSGQTFYQIDATRQPWKLFKRKEVAPKRFGSETIGRFIVAVNLLLIVLILVVYGVMEKPWSSAEQHSAGQHETIPEPKR